MCHTDDAIPPTRTFHWSSALCNRYTEMSMWHVLCVRDKKITETCVWGGDIEEAYSGIQVVIKQAVMAQERHLGVHCSLERVISM